MTVKECYEHAIALVPETFEDNPDMLSFAVFWCNILLAETLPYENAYRRTKKLPELEIVPNVLRESDEIPFNERMVKAAFPYGMARWIFRENEDISGSHECYQLYTIALTESTPLEFSEVEDFYV